MAPRSAVPDWNQAGIEETYREHFEALVRFLTFKLGNEEEARDIAQEALCRMLERADPAQVKAQRSYLFRAANNLALNRLAERQRRRENDRLAPEEAGLRSAYCPESAADARRQLELIVKELEALTPKCRQAFIAFKFEMRSYQEIAREMGITESMVRKYVLRALRHLAARLGR